MVFFVRLNGVRLLVSVVRDGGFSAWPHHVGPTLNYFSGYIALTVLY